MQGYLFIKNFIFLKDLLKHSLAFFLQRCRLHVTCSNKPLQVFQGDKSIIVLIKQIKKQIDFTFKCTLL